MGVVLQDRQPGTTQEGHAMTVDDLDTGALTVSAAARIAGVDRRVIRRHLEAGRFPGATREPGLSGTANGPWRIPIPDLQGAGLLPSDQRSNPQMEGGGEAEPPSNMDLELIRLRSELAAALRRAEAAEAAVLECDQLIKAQRLALADRRGPDSRRGSRVVERKGRHPLDGHSAGVAVTQNPSVAVVPDDPAPPRIDDADQSSDGISGFDDRQACDTVQVDVDRPGLTPRFAASWASAPPWEHAPDVQRPQRRWWQRSS
jgi:hypothetical protein